MGISSFSRDKRSYDAWLLVPTIFARIIETHLWMLLDYKNRFDGGGGGDDDDDNNNSDSRIHEDIQWYRSIVLPSVSCSALILTSYIYKRRLSTWWFFFWLPTLAISLFVPPLNTVVNNNSDINTDVHINPYYMKITNDPSSSSSSSSSSYSLPYFQQQTSFMYASNSETRSTSRHAEIIRMAYQNTRFASKAVDTFWARILAQLAMAWPQRPPSPNTWKSLASWISYRLICVGLIWSVTQHHTESVACTLGLVQTLVHYFSC